MSLTEIKQRPMQLADYGKRDVRTQFGALCWRVKNGKLQVLLVTSRRSGRWVLPKGWPVDGATPVEAAAKEAWEEAGVTGATNSICLGIFSYIKELTESESLPCVVAVFAVKVRQQHADWPEKSERQRKWMSLKKASKSVDEMELSALLKNFDPAVLRAA